MWHILALHCWDHLLSWLTDTMRNPSRERYLDFHSTDCWLVKTDVLRCLLTMLVAAITRIAAFYSADHHHLHEAFLHQDHLCHGGWGQCFFRYIVKIAIMNRHLLWSRNKKEQNLFNLPWTSVHTVLLIVMHFSSITISTCTLLTGEHLNLRLGLQIPTVETWACDNKYVFGHSQGIIYLVGFTWGWHFLSEVLFE